MSTVHPRRRGATTTGTRGKSPTRLGPMHVVAAIVLVAFAIAFLVVNNDTTEAPAGSAIAETRAVSVSGDSLPPVPAEGKDPAVGLKIPEVEGQSFDGRSLDIPDDGRPKVLMFLAHWCPHCQAEVPVVQGWLDSGAAPADVDLYSVSTAVDSAQPNYPPSQWLEREGWTTPVIADNEVGEVGEAFGLSSFPFFVFVNPDGTVASRASGELPVEEIEARIAALTR